MKKNILVVDDTPANLDVMKGILSEDYNVTVVLSVSQMLESVVRKKPDLILSDIMMPVCDGFEGIKGLRSLPGMEYIPVIFVSAKDDTETEVKAFELGAEDYIRKPVSPPVVKARVARTMSRPVINPDYQPTRLF